MAVDPRKETEPTLDGQEVDDDVMDRADARDIAADARDRVADQRDLDAAHGGASQDEFDARPQGAADRLDAKIDRIAARRERHRQHRQADGEPSDQE